MKKKEKSVVRNLIKKDRLSNHALVILLFFILSLIFTFPLILHFNTLIPANSAYDPPFYVWNSWNFQRELFLQPHNPFTTTKLLYPFDPCLSYHDYTSLRDFIILILSPVMKRIAAFNLVTLLMFTFSGYGGYLLTRRFTNNCFAAFLSGFIFGFCPFKLGRLLGHFNFIDSAFLPFFILFLIKTFEEKKLRYGLLMALFLALQGYCNYYYLVFCILFAFIYLIYQLLPELKTYIQKKDVKEKILKVVNSLTKLISIPAIFVIVWLSLFGPIYRPIISIRKMNKTALILLLVILINIVIRYRISLRKFFNGLISNIRKNFDGRAILIWILSAVFFLIIFSPIIIPVITLRDSYMGNDVMNYKVEDYPAFEDFFRISGLSSIKRFLTGKVEMDLEATISIGFIVLLLIIYSIIFLRKNKNIKFWYLSGGLFAIFALGHTLQIHGRRMLWMPYNILQSIPLIKGAINPCRFIIITMLAAGIISAVATEHIFQRIKQKWNGRKAGRYIIFTAAFLFIFIAVEYSTIPIFVYDITPHSFYYKLAQDKEDYTILEIPFSIVGRARWVGGLVNRSGLLQYYQVIHGKNLLSGYLSFIPRDIMTYYSKNEFINDISIMQDRTQPPEDKHLMIRKNKPFQRKKFLDLFNIRYIIFHKEDLIDGPDQFVLAYLDKFLPEKKKILEDKDLIVYELIPSKVHVFYNKDLLEAKNDMIFIRGWGDYNEKDNGRKIIARNSRIIFPSSIPEKLILKIEFRLSEDQKAEDISFRLFLNKNRLEDIKISSQSANPQEVSFEINIPANIVFKGSNLLDIEFGRGFNDQGNILVTNLMISK